MQRVSKAILITLGVLVILVVAAIFGLNLYVQTPATQARIQAGISEAIGLPLEITSVTVGWGGLKMAGMRIPTPGHPFLEASSFTAEYRLLPLLSRQIALRKMTLESPKIVWAQNAEGKWVLPIMPGKDQKEKIANAGPAKAPGSKAFDVVLDNLEIHNGSIELLDAKQQRVGIATGVSMKYSLRDPKKVAGTIEAERLSWGTSFNFTEVKSPLTFEHGALSLTDLRATLDGGTVQGQATVQTEEPDSPYTASVKLENVDLGRLATESGWPPDQASGAVGGALDLTGTFRDSDKLRGKGRLTIRDGHFLQFDLFQMIGQVLQIPQLADLRVKTGQAEFSFADDRTSIADLLLETPDLQFDTKGVIKYDGKMALNATLGVSESIAQQLPSFVRSNFTAPDAHHRQSISFEISGHTDKPKTNLLKRIIGQQVNNQFDDILGGIFGKKKDKKDDRRDRDRNKMDEPEPTGAAPGTPAPAPKPPTEQ